MIHVIFNLSLGSKSTKNKTFKSPRFSIKNQHHLDELEVIMNKGKSIKKTKLDPNVAKYYEKFKQVFNIIDELKVESKASMALENMYVFKKEEMKEDLRETKKLISEYRRNSINPNPKLVRLELKSSKNKKRKKPKT